VSLLTEPTAPQIVFTAPDVNRDGARLNFLLTVTDTLGLQSTDLVTVNVNEAAGLNLTGTWSSFSPATRTVSGSLAVQNIGSRKIGAFRTSFYVSEDGITPGQPLSRKTLKSLAVAQTRQLRFNYSKGASLKGKYILAVIDSTDQIKEINKGDNQVVVKLP
jgi:subtilase family serine protease